MPDTTSRPPDLVLDLDAIRPAWRLMFRVRGREVATLCPLESEAAAAPLLRSGLPGMLARAVSRLSEILCGASALARLRAAAAGCVAPIDRPLIRSLTSGETMRLLAAYEGAQAVWQREITRAAVAEVERLTAQAAPEPAATGAVTAGHRGAGGARQSGGAHARITPGGKLPQMLGGHPVGRARTDPTPLVFGVISAGETPAEGGR